MENVELTLASRLVTKNGKEVCCTKKRYLIEGTLLIYKQELNA